MRQWHGLLLGLLTGVLAGCTAPEPSRPAAWQAGMTPFQVPSGADVIQMQVALLERRAGDPYFNEGLWQLADESAVPLDRKAVLEDNGFRIGQVAGTPPPELQALLTSGRSCVNSRVIRLHTGDAKELMLEPAQAPARASLHFRLELNGHAEDVTAEQAEVMLVVVPSLTPDGRIRLHFTPQVRHGETKLTPCPAADRSGITLQSQRASDRYPALDWEVTLAPNEYAVIGGRSDRPGSLGCQAFVRGDETPAVQRLLAIRTGRTSPEGADDAADDDQAKRPPPVAYHASWNAARGTAP
ncbi:MAG TPA: hypothetical protein VJ739_07610 [Gemmataceae bacterium]|nr:hypothetical protein [Gemmataceae bacterium]